MTKGLLECKCWHGNLSCACLLDQEDRKCELLEYELHLPAFQQHEQKEHILLPIFLSFSLSTYFWDVCFLGPIFLGCVLSISCESIYQCVSRGSWKHRQKWLSGGHTSNNHPESFILFKQSWASTPDWPPAFFVSVTVTSNGWTKSCIVRNSSCSQPGSFCEVLEIFMQETEIQWPRSVWQCINSWLNNIQFKKKVRC